MEKIHRIDNTATNLTAVFNDRRKYDDNWFIKIHCIIKTAASGWVIITCYLVVGGKMMGSG